MWKCSNSRFFPLFLKPLTTFIAHHLVKHHSLQGGLGKGEVKGGIWLMLRQSNSHSIARIGRWRRSNVSKDNPHVSWACEDCERWRGARCSFCAWRRWGSCSWMWLGSFESSWNGHKVLWSRGVYFLRNVPKTFGFSALCEEVVVWWYEQLVRPFSQRW